MSHGRSPPSSGASAPFTCRGMRCSSPGCDHRSGGDRDGRSHVAAAACAAVGARAHPAGAYVRDVRGDYGRLVAEEPVLGRPGPGPRRDRRAARWRAGLRDLDGRHAGALGRAARLGAAGAVRDDLGDRLGADRGGADVRRARPVAHARVRGAQRLGETVRRAARPGLRAARRLPERVLRQGLGDHPRPVRGGSVVIEAVRYVLFYESGDLSLAVANFPAHKARYEEFMRRGVLLSLGPFTDRSGSMAVFTTQEAAEEFVSGDPFVLHGVVSKWLVREWREVTPLL